jgi:hypothetical protein
MNGRSRCEPWADRDTKNKPSSPAHPPADVPVGVHLLFDVIARDPVDHGALDQIIEHALACLHGLHKLNVFELPTVDRHLADPESVRRVLGRHLLPRSHSVTLRVQLWCDHPRVLDPGP